MNKRIIFVLILVLVCSFTLFGQDRILPEVDYNDSEELYKLLEERVSVRRFNRGSISEQVLAEILWAGHGLVYEGGSKTIHGTDAVSSATQNPRYTIPTGARGRYLRTYYLDENGVFEYLPEEHKLEKVSDKDLRSTASSVGRNASGKIIIAADTNHFSHDLIWAYLTAGSVTQNMYLAGTNHEIKMLTEGWFQGEAVFSDAGISDKIVPLVLLSFGK